MHMENQQLPVDPMSELARYDYTLSLPNADSETIATKNQAYDAILELVSASDVEKRSNVLCQATLLMTKHCSKVSKFEGTLKSLERMIDPKNLQAVRVHALRALISICKHPAIDKALLARLCSKVQILQQKEKLGVMLRHFGELQNILKAPRRDDDCSASLTACHHQRQDGHIGTDIESPAPCHPSPFAYIGNLPIDITHKLLVHLLSSVAPALNEDTVSIHRSKSAEAAYAYLTLDSVAQADRVISFSNGLDYMGRKLVASFYRGPPCKTVFIGNVRGIGEQDLRHLFGKYGKLEAVQVVPGRGFAFVFFEEIENAINAVDSMPPGYKLGVREVRVGFHVNEQRKRISETESTTSQPFTLSSGRVVGVEGARNDRDDEKNNDVVDLRVCGDFDETFAVSLISIFLRFGKCELSEADTGNGVAVVTYEFHDDAEAALSFLNGRRIPGCGEITASLISRDGGTVITSRGPLAASTLKLGQEFSLTAHERKHSSLEDKGEQFAGPAKSESALQNEEMLQKIYTHGQRQSKECGERKKNNDIDASYGIRYKDIAVDGQQESVQQADPHLQVPYYDDLDNKQRRNSNNNRYGTSAAYPPERTNGHSDDRPVSAGWGKQGGTRENHGQNPYQDGGRPSNTQYDSKESSRKQHPHYAIERRSRHQEHHRSSVYQDNKSRSFPYREEPSREIRPTRSRSRSRPRNPLPDHQSQWNDTARYRGDKRRYDDCDDQNGGWSGQNDEKGGATYHSAHFDEAHEMQPSPDHGHLMRKDRDRDLVDDPRDTDSIMPLHRRSRSRESRSHRLTRSSRESIQLADETNLRNDRMKCYRSVSPLHKRRTFDERRESDQDARGKRSGSAQRPERSNHEANVAECDGSKALLDGQNSHMVVSSNQQQGRHDFGDECLFSASPSKGTEGYDDECVVDYEVD